MESLRQGLKNVCIKAAVSSALQPPYLRTDLTCGPARIDGMCINWASDQYRA